MPQLAPHRDRSTLSKTRLLSVPRPGEVKPPGRKESQIEEEPNLR